jgi:hypothetical protein
MPKVQMVLWAKERSNQNKQRQNQGKPLWTNQEYIQSVIDLMTGHLNEKHGPQSEQGNLILAWKEAEEAKRASVRSILGISPPTGPDPEPSGGPP